MRVLICYYVASRKTNSWEHRKFGDILKSASVEICGNSSEIGKWEVIQQGFVPVAGYTDLEPCRDYENLVLFGDHTLSIYKPKSPFLVASDGVKPYYAPNINGIFLSYLFANNLPDNEGYKRYSSILKDKEIFVTYSRAEQGKISSLLDSLDCTITLHQREYFV